MVTTENQEDSEERDREQNVVIVPDHQTCGMISQRTEFFGRGVLLACGWTKCLSAIEFLKEYLLTVWFSQESLVMIVCKQYTHHDVEFVCST